MTSDDKNKWARPPGQEDDEDDIVSDVEIEKEATDAALATVELFQNFDLDEPEEAPNPRYEPVAVPPQDDELADDEAAEMGRRPGQGFSRGLFWAVGLAFGLMIAASIGVVWMIFNIIAKLS